MMCAVCLLGECSTGYGHGQPHEVQAITVYVTDAVCERCLQKRKAAHDKIKARWTAKEPA